MIRRNIYVNLMTTYTFMENALVCEQTLCTNSLRKSMEICIENLYTWCKESQFYSLPFGQAVANMY